MSNTFCHPALNLPNRLCPHDTNAFSYNPVHLDTWHMEDALHSALPNRLHKPLADMQHAGAAVLTCFQRIQDLYEELNGRVEEEHGSDGDDEYLILPGQFPRGSAECSRSGTGSSSFGLPKRTPSVVSLLSQPESRLPSGNSRYKLRGMSPHTPPELVSPILLFIKDFGQTTPQALLLNHSTSESNLATNSPSSRSNVPPQTHRISQWRAEVSFMRENCLVILRHAIRTVGVTWKDIRFKEESQSDPNRDELFADSREPEFIEAWTYMVSEFEKWLRGKALKAEVLDAQGRALGRNITLGWGERGTREGNG